MIKKLPEAVTALNRKERMMALSRLARDCVRTSSLKSKLYLEQFEKDETGVPLPSMGVFWSLSHKPGCVAGVVSKERIGIDIEQIKAVSGALFKRILDPDESLRFRSQDHCLVFFRAFTAKEAVLKKTGLGIKGLSKAKIESVLDENNLMVRHGDEKYWVENFCFDGYLASVTKDGFDVQWSFG